MTDIWGPKFDRMHHLSCHQSQVWPREIPSTFRHKWHLISRPEVRIFRSAPPGASALLGRPGKMWITKTVVIVFGEILQKLALYLKYQYITTKNLLEEHKWYFAMTKMHFLKQIHDFTMVPQYITLKTF